MNLSDFRDIHTHNLQAGDDALICLPLFSALPARGHYSVGLHPWDTAGMTPERLEQALAWVRSLAADPRVAAIGETGIDKLRGAPLDMQQRVFDSHISLSEELSKPLIIHAVRSLPEIMAMRRLMRPSQRWVIHGYRGNAETARQLLRLGFDISLGARHNPEVPPVVPPGRLFHETD